VQSAKLKNIVWIVTLSFFLLGADGGDRDERAMLLNREQALRQKIATLKREQDYLLFQKAMYAADSKYLVLNMADKTGSLKYKNRALRNFHFTASRNFPGNLQPGMLALTKKAEGKNDRRALLFGKSLIIQGKRIAIPKKTDIPLISLTKKEMLSIFSAVEEGATVYLAP
jgi:hypothetical protein